MSTSRCFHEFASTPSPAVSSASSISAQWTSIRWGNHSLSPKASRLPSTAPLLRANCTFYFVQRRIDLSPTAREALEAWLEARAWLGWTPRRSSSS